MIENGTKIGVNNRPTAGGTAGKHHRVWADVTLVSGSGNVKIKAGLVQFSNLGQAGETSTLSSFIPRSTKSVSASP